MAIVVRAYIDGSNTPRNLRAEENSGVGDDFVHYDPRVEAKAEAVRAAVAALLLPSALVGGRLAVDVNTPVPLYGNPANLAIAAGVAVTASTGTFITLSGAKAFRVQINNTGASALNGFEVSTRCHASADMQTHLNASAHFTAPPSNSILRLCGDTLGASVDPTVLTATTGKVILAFDFTNFFVETLRIRASAAAATTLQFYWGGI